MKSFRNYLYEVERRRQPDEDDDSERKPTKDKQKDNCGMISLLTPTLFGFAVVLTGKPIFN